GFEVLRWIRQQPHLKDVRVVVLTGSDSMRDVTKAYQAGANSFLIKPVDFERFVEISQALGGSWIWQRAAPQPQGETEPDSAGQNVVDYAFSRGRLKM